jgi:hypothetical protein
VKFFNEASENIDLKSLVELSGCCTSTHQVYFAEVQGSVGLCLFLSVFSRC